MTFAKFSFATKEYLLLKVLEEKYPRNAWHERRASEAGKVPCEYGATQSSLKPCPTDQQRFLFPKFLDKPVPAAYSYK